MEPRSANARRHALHAPTQLGQGDDAKKQEILIGLDEPLNNALVGPWLRPFGNDIGVEQETQSSISPGRSFLGSMYRPESRSGEAAKNSARLPDRLVFRSHSSAETTTAVIRP